ncbi:MAG: alanine--tRNA ligase [Bacteroidetes bacterium]|nr:MAG: alanine--tRNA ligase [Bacteroidota bacterium]
MTSSEIRQQFLDFFASKGHQIVPSAPIVVKNDPTLMFTNAGMNQFKDLFLGNEEAKYSRVADTQKCLRVSGKHNDLEEVGVDTYHHTMFEMLGNWSFGDYFKKEAIEWAWELLTEVYKLPKDRLYVTVFEGDAGENLAFDEEAKGEWKKWIAEDRILNGNKKDNFWEMGETGPCGPCSEIHIDLRSEAERNQVDGASLVNNDHPQVIEIWNLVFMEFNRKADSSLEPLPAKHVDTGMGFERLCRAIEAKSSNYDTDVFQPLIQFVVKETGKAYGQDEKTDIALRVLADHVRTISFAILDGQLPSNNGAGYVIRRILRRAVRYYFSFLDRKEPLLHLMIPTLAEGFVEIFPELKAKQDFVRQVVKEEETSFLRTLEAGLNLINQEITEYGINLTTNLFEIKNSTSDAISPIGDLNSISAGLHQIEDIIIKNPGLLSAEFAFKLYDTCGFPIDLTELVLSEYNIEVDTAGFQALLQEQKDRSRKATAMETGDWTELFKAEATQFIGYDELESEVRIARMRKVKQKNKEQFQLVFDRTPFYAESGGQVGDTGVIESANERIKIIDTQKENNLIVHIAERFPENPEASFNARVDQNKRKETAANHSATHLLHAALREVLGDHVEQKGSLVNENYLRFDFSHFKGMEANEIKAVERRVNEKIRENIALDERRSVPIEEAKQMGAMALFGEKYGDEVRVITFDPNYSRELCGGTHVSATGVIGLFKITSESSVAAGVRRIEAITATAAENLMEEYEGTIQSLKDLLKAKDLQKSVEKLMEEKAELEKKLQSFEAEKTAAIKTSLKNQVEQRDGYSLLLGKVEVPNAEQLKNLSFQLKNEIPNLVAVFGAILNDKPMLSVILDESLVEAKGFHAGNTVKELAKEIKGGGGGQPFYATAGGNDASGLDAALAKAKTLFS